VDGSRAARGCDRMEGKYRYGAVQSRDARYYSGICQRMLIYDSDCLISGLRFIEVNCTHLDTHDATAALNMA